MEATETCAHAGCDFVIIDAEHSPVSWQQQAAMIIAAEAAGSVPVLRVSNWSRDLISRGLDAGAHGVMIPQVETVEAAQSAVAATVYGPGGTRGVAGNRRSGFGLKIPYPEFVEASNRSTLVMLQIESVAAVERVDEIAAVPGIDSLVVGLADLSADLAVPGDWDNPTLIEHVSQIITACEVNGVAFGVPVPNQAQAARWMDRGARVIAVSDIGMLAQGLQSLLREVRS